MGLTPAQQRLINSAREGEFDVVLRRPSVDRVSGQSDSAYVLAKWSVDDAKLFIVRGVMRKTINSLINAGLVVQRKVMSDGYSVFDVADYPRVDDLLAGGDELPVALQGAYITNYRLSSIAKEFGCRILEERKIKAFRLELIGSDAHLVEPYLPGIFKLSDLRVLEWRKAIAEALDRNGIKWRIDDK